MRAAIIGIHSAIGIAGLAISAPVLAQGAPSVMDTSQNVNGRSEDLRANGLLRPDIDTPDGFRIYSRMLVMGRCLSGIGRKGAEEALDQPLNSGAERSRLANLQVRMASCVFPGLPSTLSLTRGTLSEGLYKRADSRSGPLKPEQVVTFIASQNARFASLDAGDSGLLRATDCVVARGPGGADAVLASKVGSAEESLAMDALFAVPACGSITRPARISRPYLRAFIANSAYRLTRWRVANGST